MVTWSNGYFGISCSCAELLPLTKQELGEEEPELSRTSKGNVTNQTKIHLKQLQDKTTEYARKTRRSVDLDKIRAKRDKFKKKVNDIIDIQEDDIPDWMRKPKWVKPMYFELFCSIKYDLLGPESINF